MTARSAMGRRAFLAGGSTLAVAACTPCPDFDALPLPPEKHGIADAHVHLFNAADLPIVGFVKYVLGPGQFPGVPGILLAVANIFLVVLKHSAISARRELGLQVPPWHDGNGSRVRLGRYVDEVADHIEGVIATVDEDFLVDTGDELALLPDLDTETDAGLCPAPGIESECSQSELADRFDRAAENATPDAETKASTVLLASLLALNEPSQAEQMRAIVASAGSLSDRDRAAKLLDAIVPVSRQSLARIIAGEMAPLAGQGPAATSELPDFLLRRLGRAAPDNSTARTLGYSIGSVLKWGFRMRQSRCAHLVDYMRFVENGAPVQVESIVNLMVDYDDWLGDAPAGGSSHTDQIAFWSRMREVAAERIDINTFAGFDPLKETNLRLKENARQSSYLDYLLQCFANNRHGGDLPAGNPTIQGLKLYPVMGFNPNGGNRLPGCEQAGRRVRRRWARDNAGYDFGQELDRTLDHFFATVSEQQIPLLTHARQSNYATQGGECYADLALWHSRLQRQEPGNPLHICLGHYTTWETSATAIRDIMALNYATNPRAQAYIDLSYGFDHGVRTNSCIGYDDLARCYVADLRNLAEQFDPECRFIMFASDWIMLDVQRDITDYTSKAWKLISEDDFFCKNDRLENIFRNNYRRFMRVSDASA